MMMVNKDFHNRQKRISTYDDNINGVLSIRQSVGGNNDFFGVGWKLDNGGIRCRCRPLDCGLH